MRQLLATTVVELHVERVAAVVVGGDEREASLDQQALVDGQLVAWMKRTLGKSRVDFALTPLRELAADEVGALHEAAERYGAFLGLPARLTVAE